MNEPNIEQSVTLDVEAISAELRIRAEIYVKILMSFVSTLEQKMVNLKNAVDSNDSLQMRAILHEIKGTAGNLRLQSICAPESVMHVAVKEGEAQEKLAEYFDVLNKESLKLIKYVKTLSS